MLFQILQNFFHRYLMRVQNYRSRIAAFDTAQYYIKSFWTARDLTGAVFAANKKPDIFVPGFYQRKNRLRSLDVRCLLAFRALYYVKGNLLAFLECLEAVHVDCGKVRKQIFAAIIWSDKTKTFCIVKPFYCTNCHVITFLLKIAGKAPAELFESKIAHGKPVLQKL